MWGFSVYIRFGVSRSRLYKFQVSRPWPNKTRLQILALPHLKHLIAQDQLPRSETLGNLREWLYTMFPFLVFLGAQIILHQVNSYDLKMLADKYGTVGRNQPGKGTKSPDPRMEDLSGRSTINILYPECFGPVVRCHCAPRNLSRRKCAFKSSPMCSQRGTLNPKTPSFSTQAAVYGGGSLPVA